MALWPKVSNKCRLVGRYSDSETFIIAINYYMGFNQHLQSSKWSISEDGSERTRGGGGEVGLNPISPPNFL
jgi:hypothetical protein